MTGPDAGERVVLFHRDLPGFQHQLSDRPRPVVVAALAQSGRTWVLLEEIEMPATLALELAQALIDAAAAAMPLGEWRSASGGAL